MAAHTYKPSMVGKVRAWPQVWGHLAPHSDILSHILQFSGMIKNFDLKLALPFDDLIAIEIELYFTAGI